MDVLGTLNKLGNISSEFSLGFNRGYKGEVGLGMVDMPFKRKVDPYANIWPDNYGGQSAFTNQNVFSGASAFGSSQDTINELSNRNNDLVRKNLLENEKINEINDLQKGMGGIL